MAVLSKLLLILVAVFEDVVFFCVEEDIGGLNAGGGFLMAIRGSASSAGSIYSHSCFPVRVKGTLHLFSDPSYTRRRKGMRGQGCGC